MKSIHLAESTLTVTLQGASQIRTMPPGTIYVLVRGMGLFKDLPVLLCDREATFNQDIKAIVPNTGVDPEFLAFNIVARKSAILRLVDRAGHGTGRLDTDLLKSVPVHIPPVPTQRKIAAILRTWDEAIDKLNSLIGTRDTEYAFHSRQFFSPCHPSFQGRDKGWRSFTLGQLFTERTESGLDSDVLLSITMADGVISQEDVGRRDSSTEDKSKYKLILPGDIGYNTMRMWQGVCGLSALRGIISPAYTVVTPIEKRIHDRYAFHLFKSKRMIHDFERYSQGLTSDTWNLKFPAFSEIKVFLPDPKIQIAQANYLDALKDETEVLKRKAQALARQKRGLMQKLLTGEWRVKL
jgi:type I restriction enzyme S subunit